MTCSRVRRAGRVAREVKWNFHQKSTHTRGIIKYTIRMAGTILTYSVPIFLKRRCQRTHGRSALLLLTAAHPIYTGIATYVSYSVPLFLKRQCDRTLGGRARRAGPRGIGHGSAWHLSRSARASKRHTIMPKRLRVCTVVWSAAVVVYKTYNNIIS